MTAFFVVIYKGAVYVKFHNSVGNRLEQNGIFGGKITDENIVVL